MIYYTGDIHGQKYDIIRFCEKFNLTKDDTVIILGDVGANYYGNNRDTALKDAFKSLNPTILCIHGNHEKRPVTISTYKEKEWNGGTVWYEEAYPNLLLPKTAKYIRLKGFDISPSVVHTVWTSITGSAGGTLGGQTSSHPKKSKCM